MKKNIIGFFTALSVIGFILTGCETDPESFSGIRLSASQTTADPDSTTEISATYIKEDTPDTSAQITLTISNDSTEGAYFGTSGTKTATVKSGAKATLTLGSKNSEFVTISATYGNMIEKITVGTSLNPTLSAADRPHGFASYNASANFGGYKGSLKGTVVTTRKELKDAISKAGIIYVKGMIDITDEGSGTKLPAPGSYSTDTTAALDAWVNEKSSGKYETYPKWVSAYGAACSTSTDDRSGKSPQSSLYSMMSSLNSKWKSVIQLNIKSNTTIIGIPDENGVAGGIRGGAISISKVSNVAIRNLVIQDGVDLFTHHEADDGFNAQFDNIGIDGASNVWIDHCTLEDTLTLGSAGEKWQIYDGLCDIKGSTTNITVSYCQFKNHDKTMLIGSSDSDGSNEKRFVTLHHNYFYNCGQRLPMVRNTKIHIFNNYYHSDGKSGYSNQYAIGCRKDSLIVAENNTFSGVTATRDSDGILYATGNNTGNAVGKKPFEPTSFYLYVMESASAVTSSLLAPSGITAAGAGKVSVSYEE